MTSHRSPSYEAIHSGLVAAGVAFPHHLIVPAILESINTAGLEVAPARPRDELATLKADVGRLARILAGSLHDRAEIIAIVETWDR